MWLTLHHRKSTVDVGAPLNVSSKTVQRMVDRFLSTGEVEPSQKKNGPEYELTEFEEMIKSMKILVSIFTNSNTRWLTLLVPVYTVLLYAGHSKDLVSLGRKCTILLFNKVRQREVLTWQRYQLLGQKCSCGLMKQDVIEETH